MGRISTLTARSGTAEHKRAGGRLAHDGAGAVVNASDLKGIPLKTLQELEGWKTHGTILECYQHVDEEQLREALEDRRRA